MSPTPPCQQHGAGTSVQPQTSVGAEVAAITVASRLSDFWCDRPQLWFDQTEAILAPQKLSDETRYNLVVGKLGKHVLEQVTDLLRSPPESGKFQALKTRLISVYQESESRQFEKLLALELGEQKPSQLLRRMRDLAQGKVTDETLAKMWTRLLPASVKGILAVTGTKDLESNAQAADKIFENVRTNDVAEVASTPGTSSDLGDQIAKLTAQFAQFQRDNKPWRRANSSYARRGRSPFRSRNPRQRSSSGDNGGLCYYHYNFKERARKCSSPCNWKIKTQEN